MPTSTEQRNMELMQTLDDAWNAQDQKVFRKRHKPDVVVWWPGTTEKSSDLDFYTVAKCDNGQIVEENLMYDLVTFLKQIGLGK